MTSQFAIFSTCNLPDGTILLAGDVTGARLSTGQRGRGITRSGEVAIEILSLGLRDPILDKPNLETLRAKILAGDGGSLKGATLDFD